jgi:hypothetical protein
VGQCYLTRMWGNLNNVEVIWTKLLGIHCEAHGNGAKGSLTRAIATYNHTSHP